MSIRDYPGFKWKTIPNTNGGSYDVWEPAFSHDAIISIEGKFFNVSSMRPFETIHEAMEFVRNYAIIKYFDEN
jgi:hypothetical protein